MLVINASAVGFHGFYADTEFLGDLATGVALNQIIQHFRLPLT